eukprot:SM000034S12760  [mRNA]  locus=s34:659439:661244:+ [translate_table: standard]
MLCATAGAGLARASSAALSGGKGIHAQLAALAVDKPVLEAVSRANGWDGVDAVVTRVDVADARWGTAALYEFAVGVGHGATEFSMSEEAQQWEYLLPAVPSDSNAGKDLSLPSPDVVAALPPFQLAGPVEIWIQDGQHMRLSVPHDVDAGELTRVVIADGATVTVKGAREVSLARPVDLTLPLRNTSEAAKGAALVELLGQLKAAARGLGRPALSLRILGPTALVAASARAELPAVAEGQQALSGPGRIKVRRISETAVELHSRASVPESLGHGALDQPQWPIPDMNLSDAKLAAIEEGLLAVLGKKANKQGSFQLLRAKATAVTLVRLPLELERRALAASEKDEARGAVPGASDTTSDQEHRARQQWEVMARVDGGVLHPVSITPMTVILPSVSVSVEDKLGMNMTSKYEPQALPPLSAMLLGDPQGQDQEH